MLKYLSLPKLLIKYCDDLGLYSFTYNFNPSRLKISRLTLFVFYILCLRGTPQSKSSGDTGICGTKSAIITLAHLVEAQTQLKGHYKGVIQGLPVVAVTNYNFGS